MHNGHVETSSRTSKAYTAEMDRTQPHRKNEHEK